ncbi:dTDP-4-dehydrorhamnose reductase [Paenibacillus lactis]|uniref:dTDP-4-dehydrorhamnose reductase n=1 Tax=Paenibacillus lactis TaxID=228574 RepID=A0ABS4F3W1_9BACL|nr:dTDP-4-dehydrorhamnose reductase [Paenibacillus lactis]MBP1890944.1 dTDP-4-dehydrorhamnose reductase [Paenibacillus lactis]HAF99148.1 dTDP-4-dehydrorhamnose reductase [Paenibacillus lactis]
MKVLVTGANGQLGQDVVNIFSQAGHEVIGCKKTELNITDEEQCRQVISAYTPDCIIHCAAYTAVDAAESDIDGAFLVNATGTRNVALSAEMVGAKLVYISTDYVFNGESDKPYQEFDFVDPRTIYGKSKYAGEQMVKDFCSRWYVVRTSWVYGLFGSNFVKTMLRLGQEKNQLQVVNDQKGSPTYTVDLARFLVQLITTERYGIYHASNSGSCTWFEFTEAIFAEGKERLGITVTAKLEPCTTAQFPRPAPRPANSVLEHLAIRLNGFEDLPHWRDGLKRFILEMEQNDIR